MAPEKQAEADILGQETSKIIRQINLGDKNILEIFLNSFCKNPKNFQSPEVFLEKLKEFSFTSSNMYEIEFDQNTDYKIFLCSYQSDEEEEQKRLSKEEKERLENVINGAVDVIGGTALILCPHPVAHAAGAALIVAGGMKIRENFPIKEDEDDE